ncbi:hypothetical protein QBC39DRAFT_374178 [Podospora conica]|nr:hypothetical protein QBC39DRAFT_374178 [Schizothecium conicum]
MSFSPEPHRGYSADGAPASPSPRTSSLQAAATLNAGLQREEPGRASPRSPLHSNLPPSASVGRRRSQIHMNLQIADPSIPSPGEMVSDPWSAGYQSGSPHFPPSPAQRQWGRNPSLGELHQELESEQEYHVNRLLAEISRLQAQVQRQQSGENSGSAVADDSAPPSAFPGPGSLPRSPGFPPHARGSFDFARADLSRRSRTSSRGASPALRTTSIGDSSERLNLAGRDENAFYQAETQMLVRENQMLRMRIKELEKNLAEASGTAATASITHEPPQASHLHESTTASAEAPSQQEQATVPEVPKETQQ